MANENLGQGLSSEEIARAWRDVDYFDELNTTAKMALPQHPAGEIAWQAGEPSVPVETLAPVPGNPCGGSIAPCSFAPCSISPCTFVPCH